MITTLENLITLRKSIFTFVLTNGVFDILHVGHIRYLRDAKRYGDRLVVAINDDYSTKLNKGQLRPIIPIEERMEIINSLSFVDYVIKFSEKNVINIIKKLRPYVHAKGTDYIIDSVPEKEEVIKYGGRTVICGDPKDHSSTKIIKNISKGIV